MDKVATKKLFTGNRHPLDRRWRSRRLEVWISPGRWPQNTWGCCKEGISRPPRSCFPRSRPHPGATGGVWGAICSVITETPFVKQNGDKTASFAREATVLPRSFQLRRVLGTLMVPMEKYPPLAGLLFAIDVPPYGGDTLFLQPGSGALRDSVAGK